MLAMVCPSPPPLARPTAAHATAAESSAAAASQRRERANPSRVELAAPQWPNGLAANGMRAALHLFAADEGHCAGRARAHSARGVQDARRRSLAQPAVRKKMRPPLLAGCISVGLPCSPARSTSGTVHKTILIAPVSTRSVRSRTESRLMTLA